MTLEINHSLFETTHIKKRARQRGITNTMIELTLEYGQMTGDKIKLGKRAIKNLLAKDKTYKSDLLKIMDKGGLIVVFSGMTLITVYAWR